MKPLFGLIFLVASFEATAQVNTLEQLRESIRHSDSLKAERIKSASSFRLNKPGFLLVDIINGVPIYRSILNAESAITTGAANLQSGTIGLALQGEGLTLGVWDDGKISNHVEFGDRIIANEGTSFGDHATHVTGTLIASGINPAAKGMAPKAKVTAQYYDNDDAEMAALARPDQSSLLFSSHSYGQSTGWSGGTWVGDPTISQDEDFHFGFYGERAVLADQIAYLAPYYSIVWAAGNDRIEKGNGTHPPDCNNGTGYDCIIPDAVAKNIITVGAIGKVLNYTGPNSAPMSNFSSWGPTDDGRIKPDLVGDGIDVFSTIASGTNQYTFYSGTSMATPNVTGSLSLLQELYSKLHGGKLMRAATLKALAIHTTKETGSFPGPDYSFGWGLLDVEAGAKLLLAEDSLNTIIEELTLLNNEKLDLILSPVANQKITATIVWTDPAGTPVADKLDPTDLMLVNDLDMKLIDNNGNEILPWTLDPGNPSKGATKGNNFRDNVEKIEFDAPAAKSYHLTVSHKGKLLNGKQDFSLIVNYQSSTNIAQTYYWIGNSGDWADPAHWSPRSGGSTSNKVPGSNDYVIVDENSFQNSSQNQISLSNNQSVSSLLWICSKPAGIALNDNQLRLSKSLKIASPVFQSTTSGSFLLSSSSKGEIVFSNNQLNQLTLNISDGSWKWAGNTELGSLILDEGTLQMDGTFVKVNQLKSNSGKKRNWRIINSTIELAEASIMTGLNLTIDATATQLNMSGDNATLDWDKVSWNGTMNATKGQSRVLGNNVIHKLNLSADIELAGSNQLDTLLINKGVDLKLGDNSEQAIETIQIISLASGPVKVHSNSNSSINLSQHQKFCFDFLQVTNVETKGTGVINAGENAVLVNAKGWNSRKCEDVLFADFKSNYPCENGLTGFVDNSQGPATEYKWTFPESITKTGKEQSFSFTSKGSYPVTLTVGDGVGTNSYTKDVNIISSTLPANQIIANADEMYSFNQAQSYQWYRNETILANETQRKYLSNGLDGNFFIVTYDKDCNRISDVLTITGLEEQLSGSRVYPNPANQEINIQSGNEKIDWISIRDVLGRTVSVTTPETPKLIMSVGHLNDGIYLVEMSINNKIYRDKIIIKHQ